MNQQREVTTQDAENAEFLTKILRAPPRPL